MKVKMQPKISVVIPVYNAEKYLDECIQSVINQDFGFKENIELILINDGSKDLSDEICQKYANKYPDNVIYVKQENAGASAARNVGIEKATGEFISFIDADDYITTDAVRAVMNYFEKAPKDVNVAIIDVHNIGAKQLRRPISDKFLLGTHTAGLMKPGWYDVCPRIAPSFIRAEVAKRFRLQEDVTYFEDTLFVNEILMETMKLGVVAKGRYYYRRFQESDKTASITSGALEDKDFYLGSPVKVSLELLKTSTKRFGETPLYFQFLALYEMRWRTFYKNSRVHDTLDGRERRMYERNDQKILSYISDEAIMKFDLYNDWQKIYLLNMKHEKDILLEAKFDKKDRLVWNGQVLFNHWKNFKTNLTDIYIVANTLVLKGYFIGFVTEGLDVFAIVNKEKMKLEIIPDMLDSTIFPLEHKPIKRAGFVVRVPLDDKRKVIRFGFSINKHDYAMDGLGISTIFASEVVVPKQRVVGKYIVKRRKNCVDVVPKTAKTVTRYKLGKIKRKVVRNVYGR